MYPNIMQKKLPGGKILKTTTTLVGAIRQTLTSPARHRQRKLPVCPTKERLCLLFILTLFSLVLSANTMTLNQKRVFSMEKMNTGGRLEEKRTSFTSQCRKCAQLRRLTSRFDVTDQQDEITSSHPSMNKLTALARKLRQSCDKMTYQRCKIVYPWKNEIKLTSQNGDKRSKDTRMAKEILPAITRTTTTSSNDDVSSNFDVLSRKKRTPGGQIEGDRRLIDLFCMTHYILEIKHDGTVTGSRVRNANTLLEIQSVEAGGVVSFQSKATGLYLAMDKKGRLYGTKHFSKEHSAFVERMRPNFYNTYSARHYPRKHGKSKRSASGDWYVAIGKHGTVRKANRIGPTHSAAQFLPLYRQ
ncbi:unnamed protein product [Clavelina lepadiformis]|uniref:FGF n=1 Tax=Clavelina lepadiformis TaxID=159417 RepID=A0ABP0FKU5_CLALP